MSNTINNGGPAFPTESEHQSSASTWHHEGMTLRDYFSAEAMQGLLARSVGNINAEIMANDAYQMADAMLRARGEA